MNNQELTFSDVMIKPKYSEVVSRSHVDISTNISPFISPFGMPLVASNMKHVIGVDMSEELHKEGGMTILHRFQSIDDNIKEYQEIITK